MRSLGEKSVRVPGRGCRLFLHVPADQGSAGLDECLLWPSEGIRKVALDTDLCHDSFLHEYRHYDIGFHEIGSEVARMGGNIIDGHGFSGSGRGSAQSFV